MNKTTLGLIAMFTMCNYWVIAQEDTTRATSLNEIVITATRFPKKVSETGKVVTVIDNRQ